MDRGDLANLSAFVTVADQRSFRAAASRLDVTPSALSHSMRQVEARLGVRLLNRTTRSVSVTDAGQRLLEQLRPALGQVSDALEDLNRERSRPFGRLRIYATNMAGAAVITPVWQRFLSTYPEVHLELQLGEAPSILWRRDSTPVSEPRLWQTATAFPIQEGRLRQPERPPQALQR
jgi:DNA-binding transcriptional LysR family regulator